MRVRDTGERGQVTPLVLVVVAVAVVACLVTGALGEAAVERARARTAADAAALAGAVAGEAAAKVAAEANGAALVRFERIGGDAEVEVHLGRARAVARARPGWVEPAPAG